MRRNSGNYTTFYAKLIKETLFGGGLIRENIGKNKTGKYHNFLNVERKFIIKAKINQPHDSCVR